MVPDICAFFEGHEAIQKLEEKLKEVTPLFAKTNTPGFKGKLLSKSFSSGFSRLYFDITFYRNRRLFNSLQNGQRRSPTPHGYGKIRLCGKE